MINTTIYWIDPIIDDYEPPRIDENYQEFLDNTLGAIAKRLCVPIEDLTTDIPKEVII